MVDCNRFRDRVGFREWLKGYKGSEVYRLYRRRLSCRSRLLYYVGQKNGDYCGRNVYFRDLLFYLGSVGVSLFPVDSGDNRLVEGFFSRFPVYRGLVGFSLDSLPALVSMALSSSRKRYRLRPRGVRLEWEKKVL